MFQSKYYKFALLFVGLFIFLAAPLTYRFAEDKSNSSTREGFYETTSLKDTDERTLNFAAPSGESGQSMIFDPNSTDSALPIDDTYYPYNETDEDFETEQSERAVEKSGYFDLECEDIRSDFDSIKNFAVKYDGYIVSSSFSGGESQSASVTLRLPADKFDEAVIQLRDLDVEIISESVSTVDRQNRLTELNEIISDLKAQVIELENQLAAETDSAVKASIQKKIDNLKIQLNYNTDEVENVVIETSYSTLNVTLTQGDDSFQFGSDWDDISDTAEFFAIFWIQVFVALIVPSAAIVIFSFIILKVVKARKIRKAKSIQK